jgi:LuxR family maltose regulon positive regulatory protein
MEEFGNLGNAYANHQTNEMNRGAYRKQSMLDATPQIDVTKHWKIVQDKIVVPSPTGRIPRPRLEALLSESLKSCTSTIISGRAGSGKTTLAIDFADRSGRAVAWYKVEAPESNLVIFLEYLISSIRRCRPDFGGNELLSLLQEELHASQISRLAEVFVFELELQAGSPLLVVIEDLHQVCDAEWVVPFFGRLLPLLPADVHMLISSRTMPPTPLWRMRSKQTLSVIHEEALYFTRAEANLLFEHYGLTQEQARIALDHSHGRAAALSNLAATLQFAEAGFQSDELITLSTEAE